jgi:hypothetical protein
MYGLCQSICRNLFQISISLWSAFNLRFDLKVSRAVKFNIIKNRTLLKGAILINLG